MTVDLNAVKIYIRPGATDLRKAAKGLTVLVQDRMKLDPLSGSVYLFCNKGRRLLKAVWRDRTGFWLAQKRLEEAKFPWLEDSREAEELDASRLKMLLAGIDFFKAHKPLQYQRVS
ncbi:MAG: IS66 family insertion sequence element accessory protein TnpB [Treponema sp.]|nr:IS66 family insertion sequence element accessory protein TnpB [Treponema sp.]